MTVPNLSFRDSQVSTPLHSQGVLKITPSLSSRGNEFHEARYGKLLLSFVKGRRYVLPLLVP